VDYSKETSLHNWVSDLQLECKSYSIILINQIGVSKTKIGFIGSSLFIGWTIAAIFLARVSDVYGRKRVFIYSMIGNDLAYLGLIISRNIDVNIVLIFLMGLFSVGRASVGYLYLQELIPKST
jgi:MFS family permease